nr:hypothetical protein [Tanacetum cinerariifolium]
TVEDKILVPKPPKSCARCTRCGYLVDGPNCQGCALLRQELKENLVAHSPDFQNSFEPSNASTNIVNAPRQPNVVKQDNGSFVDKIIFRAPDSPDQFHCFHCKDNSLNDSSSISETSSQSPPNINHCCYECGDPLDGIFCKRCPCKSCGKDAHIGYNCPSTAPVISNPEPGNNQTINELLQTLPIFHLTFQSEAESPFTLDSTPTYVDESPNVFNPPPQPSVYPCEFCGNDAYYGHYCTPQAPLIYPEPCYNQDFNFPQYFQDLNNTLAKITKQMTSITSWCEIFCQFVQKKQEEKRIEEEQVAKAQTWKLSDDDDDEESSNSLNDHISELPSYSAITPDEPVLSTEEPDISLKVMEIVIPEVRGIKASNDNPIPSYDPIIPRNPPNLTPSGE